MKGIIHLKGYKIIADESIYPGKYSFKAQHDRERTFFFYTDTKESMRTWIKMLMKATITRDFDGEFALDGFQWGNYGDSDNDHSAQQHLSCLPAMWQRSL